MKEPIFKTLMPDGRIAVTLLVSDLELANELFKIAKKNKVEVVEADQALAKSSHKEKQEEIFKRISQIADEMKKQKAPEKKETLAERLANKIKK